MSTASKPLSLPWNQPGRYWIALLPRTDAARSALLEAASGIGLDKREDSEVYFIHPCDYPWKEHWERLRIVAAPLAADTDISVIRSETEPVFMLFDAARKPLAVMDNIAGSLWLGEAVQRDDIICYLQPVMSAHDKVFGYESFARARAVDGSIIGGGAIVAASKALGIEYAIDRQLHIQAVKTFVSSNVNGFLFVNLFPGFIQRPEVYLEGLTETAKTHGVVSKYIVLDFTDSEASHDLTHLKRVTDYCRSKGYAISLDDLLTEKGATRLIPEIRPDFVKLDMKLVQQLKRASDREMVKNMIDIAHKHGCSVIAEGVETDEIFTMLKELNVDLFQGYLFSPPVAMEPVPKQNAAG